MRRNSAGLGGDDLPGLQPAAHVLEARRLEPRFGLLGAGVVPGLAEALEVTAHRALAPATSSLIARSRSMLPAPPHWAARRPPGFSAACDSPKRRIVVEDPVEDGAGERPHRPALASSSSVRSATSASSWGRRTSRPSRPSTPSRRPPITRPWGRRSISICGDPAGAAAGVEHGLVAAQLESLEDRLRPLLVRDGDALVARRVPLARAGHQSARRHRAAARPPDCLEGVDRGRVLQRDADVVEAVQQPVLDVGLDLELEDAGGAGDVSSSTSIRASPASATARQCSSSRIAGSSPILVQLE